MPPFPPYTRIGSFAVQVAQPNVSTSPLPPDESSQRTAYLSSSLTSVIACLTPMLALMYCCALFWTYRYAQRYPRPLNKTSGLRLQRYAPWVYVFLVFTSLAEISLGSWLLIQYRFYRNYPNVEAYTGIKLLLFSACWTTLTAGAYTLLFLHPTWSKQPISSVGAQAIWVFLTWVLWVAGAGIVNTALPSLLVKGSCDGLVYCGQIQTVVALSVLEILTLTGGMATMMWLAWQSTRNILRPEPFQ